MRADAVEVTKYFVLQGDAALRVAFSMRHVLKNEKARALVRIPEAHLPLLNGP